MAAVAVAFSLCWSFKFPLQQPVEFCWLVFFSCRSGDAAGPPPPPSYLPPGKVCFSFFSFLSLESIPPAPAGLLSGKQDFNTLASLA